MPLTLRVLVGLVAGFLVGLALAYAPPIAAGAIASAASTIGAIFINLIRMTAIPLVVSMLVASVGSVAASAALARLGGRAAVLTLALVAAAALIAVAIAAPVLARMHVDATAALALRGPAAATTPPTQAGAPALARWVVDLVPQNPVKAAADGTILPLIVFTVLFALALARVPEARRSSVLRVVEGVADAMQRLVAGILTLAPFGVFALAIPLASTLGVSAVGAVAAYVTLVVLLTILVGAVVLYPVGILMGPMTARAFIAFCAPAQAVAFAARSSLAALPAMIESADRAKLPQVVSGFIVPLGASLFRVGAAVAQPVGVLFLARLYGLALTPSELVSIVLTTILTTFAVPGIPGGSIIAMVPVLAAANVPVDGIGILLAVDTVPDMFRTTANVTGTMALAAALSTRNRRDR